MVKPALKMTIIISIVLVIATLSFFLIPLFLRGTDRYHFESGKLYYGEKEITDINLKQYKFINAELVKDSTHVFLKGEILQWADAPTFHSLDNEFVADKNGLYYTTIRGWFSSIKVKPLEGDFDKASFQHVGGLVYKDKNGLYICRDMFTLFQSSEPLKAIDTTGIDVASLKLFADKKGLTTQYWYADRSYIYFGKYGELRQCPEIDLKTFEPLCMEIYKDKQRVYYLTQIVYPEGSKRTRSENYDILEGADGATFHIIETGDSKFTMVTGGLLMRFEDKNARWELRNVRIRIRRGGWRHERIIYRIEKGEGVSKRSGIKD